MEIRMTGLDYKSAELAVREQFALGGEKAGEVMAAYMALPCINACAVIFTCNRTEVYISIEEGRAFDISGFLCRMLGRDAEQYTGRFTERNEAETFCHLCGVAAGIDSQLLGDDQIITQVREALEASRAAGFTDSYLETLFRTAIKAAKEIKTAVAVRASRSVSAPHKAVEKIKALGSVAGERAVVIGNGRMGRLAAELLLGEKARVTVTLREYKKGIVQIPGGADTIGYGSRYTAIDGAGIVVSATTSPHYTLRCEDFTGLNAMPRIVADLAVPRDVEPGIGEIPGVTLLTIDDLGDETAVLPPEIERAAGRIVEKNLSGYYKWRAYKENSSNANARVRA